MHGWLDGKLSEGSNIVAVVPRATHRPSGVLEQDGANDRGHLVVLVRRRIAKALAGQTGVSSKLPSRAPQYSTAIDTIL